MNILELSEQEIVRRNSLNTMREMGIDPYPAAEFPVNAYSDDIREQFCDDAAPRQVSIAGRIMSRRIMAANRAPANGGRTGVALFRTAPPGAGRRRPLAAARGCGRWELPRRDAYQSIMMGLRK